MDEKCEDHPLWGEFVKWMGVRHGKGLPHSQDDWHCFIAGAEAMGERLKSPSAIVDLIQTSSLHAKLDKIIRIAETPSLASEAIDELNRMDKRLDTAFGLSHKMAAKLDQMLVAVQDMPVVQVITKHTPPIK